jgi:hypothetical protein
MTPDFFNCCFEAVGAYFIAQHIRQVLKDKAVKGLYIPATAFFMLWGFWNLFFYPHLHQWWSFSGGLAIVTANAVWVALLLKYRTRMCQLTNCADRGKHPADADHTYFRSAIDDACSLNDIGARLDSPDPATLEPFGGP